MSVILVRTASADRVQRTFDLAGRFDQYMYPYYKKDLDSGKITRAQAQELMDCIWVKLNDLNKCRDAASAEGFAGYSLFQNLIAGGQNAEGIDGPTICHL